MIATLAQGSPAASKAVHYKSQPIARRKNQSAVYYAAYVTGTVLHDARRDETFWRKDSQGDVLHWEIVGPQGAEGWTLAELWNGAEAAAKKVNERPGRQTVIGPCPMNSARATGMPRTGSRVGIVFGSAINTASPAPGHFTRLIPKPMARAP